MQNGSKKLGFPTALYFKYRKDANFLFGECFEAILVYF